MKSKKHTEQKPCATQTIFFQANIGKASNSEKPNNHEKESSNQTLDNASKLTQSTIDSMVEQDNILTAEICWVHKVIQSNYSQCSSEGISDLFKSNVFWEQNCGKVFLWENKMWLMCYIINHMG